ncbi:ABC transporter ATP-binding protein [Pararobbsia alpina]|uniref:sn-glycerol-3-phosphate import ATP-binding protein UgpC n=1 Tax=Pararobbsia alpina TaxID=621374 RepID=A0A6S7BPK2_9BURK|nr:ABC transporter ATP-binding protein [Pararobbsia alpina]CAB3798366.1 sn-glycerol-3-phosphate import ATP-binding protein UgpC [Pararobbsia alpina]
MARLELKSVRKSFGSTAVIHGIDLVVEDGSFTVFVGPSGCGKSTLLRMIAGLEEVSSGEVHLDGIRCDHLLPSARGMAMVFQSYALYPHMNIHENLRFGLVCQKTPKAEIEPRIQRAAEILQISHLLDRKPSQLSGGQSQRVAIGRAIVKQPKAFLFDEPLSNLDAELRVKMRGEIVALHQRLKATMVYVTHDQVEAMTMADTIVVLRNGRIEQVGSPAELYARPVNQFVAGFLGSPQMNMLAGLGLQSSEDRFSVSADGGRLRLQLARRAEATTGDLRCTLGIRPEHLALSERGALRVTVTGREFLGSETIVSGTLQSGESIRASLRGAVEVALGESVAFEMDLDHLHVFDQDGAALDEVDNALPVDSRQDEVRQASPHHR